MLYYKDIEKAVENSDIILITSPASSHKELGELIGKNIKRKTLIVLNPGRTFGALEFKNAYKDLAKSRVMISLVKSLEDDNFKVILQTRAGLDYFKPDLEEAKMQLAAVTALMDDIEPVNEVSPEIIHVVSYSEALQLATPDIVNESIQITQHSLKEYRKLRKAGKIEDMSKNLDVQERMYDLMESAKILISGIEKHIDNPYSAQGFYKIFAAGFLPVPYLWSDLEEFKYAKHWKTRPVKGSIKVLDENNQEVKSEKLLDYALGNFKDVDYILKQKFI